MQPTRTPPLLPENGDALPSSDTEVDPTHACELKLAITHSQKCRAKWKNQLLWKAKGDILKHC